MNPSILSGTRGHLVKQLNFFDERKSIFFDLYFPQPNQEKEIVSKQIERYIQTLENLLAHDDQTLDQSLKTVTLLGSSVKIRFEEDGTDETFTVVYPTEIEPELNRISFLSPIGRQLLLASRSDRLTLHTPASRQPVQIVEVKYAYIGGFSAC